MLLRCLLRSKLQFQLNESGSVDPLTPLRDASILVSVFLSKRRDRHSSLNSQLWKSSLLSSSSKKKKKKDSLLQRATTALHFRKRLSSPFLNGSSVETCESKTPRKRASVWSVQTASPPFDSFSLCVFLDDGETTQTKGTAPTTS